MKDAKAIRELSAALGMDEGGTVWGLLLAVGVIAVLATAMLLVTYGGQTAVVYGRMLGFGLVETDQGSFPLARVSVDGRDAMVSLPRSTSCRTGDAIQLIRGKGFIGYRYRLGLRGCSAWFASQGATPGFGAEWTCSDGRRTKGGGLCSR